MRAVRAVIKLVTAGGDRGKIFRVIPQLQEAR